MNIDYRIIREDDAPAMLDFFRAVGGDTDNLSFSAADFVSTDAEAERYAIREMRKGRNVYALAITDGKIIGCCDIRSIGERIRIRHRAEMAVAVRKEFWGQGIADHLLQFTIAEAKEHGITKITTSVRSDNEHGIAFLARNGFFHEGRDSRLLYIDGKYIDGEHYSLEL